MGRSSGRLVAGSGATWGGCWLVARLRVACYPKYALIVVATRRVVSTTPISRTRQIMWAQKTFMVALLTGLGRTELGAPGIATFSGPEVSAGRAFAVVMPR